jgi:hypothetical protein
LWTLEIKETEHEKVNSMSQINGLTKTGKGDFHLLFPDGVLHIALYTWYKYVKILSVFVPHYTENNLQ